MRTSRLIIRRVFQREPPALTFGDSYIGKYIRTSISDAFKDYIFTPKYLKSRLKA